MLRVDVYCSLLSSPRQVKLVDVGSRSLGSWQIQQRSAQRLLPKGISVKAVKDGTGGETSGFRGQSWEPESEIEVPFEQRPVNEYSSLKEGTLYSWGDLGPGQFFLRLGGLWLVTFTVLGAPIGAYEETGWYDGQMWVKPPEVLARDRLLGSYKVKPVIKLLKQTLVGTGVLLVSAVMLFIFATPVEDFIQTTFSTKENSSNVSVSKMRRDELLKLPMEVKSDDDLAAAAAEAADGRPVYCRDRFYRALAGGQYCKSDDLLMK